MKNRERKEKMSKAALVLYFLNGCKKLFLASMISAVFYTLADVIGPQIIRMTVDNAIIGEKANYSPFVMKIVGIFGGFEYLGKHLWIPALVLLAVAFVKDLFHYLFRVSNTRASETLVKSMRDRLFSHIERLPYSWHTSHHTGDIIQRCTSDIETMRGFVSDQMTNLFRIAMMIVASMIFMLSMNVPMALIAFAPVPLIVTYSYFFHLKMKKSFRECEENEGRLSAMIQENLTGVRVVRAFGREEYEKDRFDRHNQYYTGLWVKVASLMSRFWASNDVFFALQIMMIITVGAVFCVKGDMKAGEYIAFISYNSMLIWPIRRLGRLISSLSKANVAMERIKEITDAEEENYASSDDGSCMHGDIEFRNVSFSYDGKTNVLENVSFKVPSGTTLGILGGTGSGKSTVSLLLDRMFDIEEGCGEITIGGKNINEIGREVLRKNTAVVLQEPFLFSGTIRDNITMSSDDLTQEELDEVTKAACLKETIDEFGEGYETLVGERGVTLSGGQKQRVAIARALAAKAPVMIFDDSLSAVDMETDAKIRASIEKRFGSATIIIISHRITTLSKADRIIVFDRGKITESGTHEELISRPGLYRDIYDIQSLGREEAEI